MARPNKTETIAINKRNAEILEMDKKGYPLDYISSFYNLTKGRIVQILKDAKDQYKNEVD